MERLDRQLRGEAIWDGQSGNDRMEYGLMAGYVIVAIVAAMASAKTGIGVELEKVVPEALPAARHEFLPSLVSLLGTSTDIIAAVGLLTAATVMLYRRSKSDPEPKPITRRFDIPFLF